MVAAQPPPSGREFAVVTELIQLSCALEQYKVEVDEASPVATEEQFYKFVELVYGKGTTENPKFKKLDINERLTFLLNIDTWPIDYPNEKSHFVFYEFRNGQLTDNDGDGWLEYNTGDGRMFRIRKGECCIWDKKTNQFQFADYD